MHVNRQFFNILQKYDVAGPRYTSYPTAPAWTEAVTARDYEERLERLKKGERLSLYVHLPFCENLCHFCGCMKVITTKREKSRDYVKSLKTEIDRVASRIPSDSREVIQLHLGGGTPNFLAPDELEDLILHLKNSFCLLPTAEIAIEMHPRTSTRAFCEKIASLGFNRVSLGVQDLDPVVQKLINRHQTHEQTEAMVKELQVLGFQEFNFDLIYGLPGQTLEGWQKTLDQVIALRPNRLAVYSYAHVPWLKPYQRSFEDKDLPSPEKKLQLFERAYEAFTHNSYQLIGMDHFALQDDELAEAFRRGTLHRNFMGYSTKADAHQIGLGVSAISYVGGDYFQNRKELDDYYAALNQPDALATFRGFLLNQDDHLRRDLIQSIMCRGKVDLRAFEKTWNITFSDYFRNAIAALQPLQADGLLSLDHQTLEVTGSGFLFLRNIAMVFDRYLSELRAKSSNPVFSKTV